jgi:hypothetical protein
MASALPARLGAALLAAAGPALAAADPPPRPGVAHVTVETIAIDRRGTWSAGADEADLRSGTEGVLERSTTLIGRLDRGAREMIRLTARIVPVLQAGGVCTLKIDSTVTGVRGGSRAAPAGTPPETRSVLLDLGPDQERLVEVYSSAHTEGRVALKVRCAEALAVKAPDPRIAGFALSVTRTVDEGQLTPLKNAGLSAAIGRAASHIFAFNVPLEETEAAGRRYRREHLEVWITPLLFRDARLQFELRVTGELATVAARLPTESHPVDRAEIVDLGSGGTHVIEIEIASSSPAEGWSKVTYRLTVACDFTPPELTSTPSSG